MASWRAHFLREALLRTKKPFVRGLRDPLAVRAVFSKARSLSSWRVRFHSASLGGVSGEWALKKNGLNENAPTLLYLHGGAYIGMSPQTHRGYTGGFAQRGYRIFAPAYRLAPENPFPAALDDAYAAWRALRAQTDGPIFIAGDSAGGGLTLALMMKLRDRGEEGPAGACVFSPWTDLALTGASLSANDPYDPSLSAHLTGPVAAMYLGETEARNPLASPLYGDFSGLAPLIIFVGDTEILLDDSLRVAEKARAAHIPVDLHVWPIVVHGWPIVGAILPEARKALDLTVVFFQKAMCGIKKAA